MTQRPPLTLDAITKAVAALRPDEGKRAEVAAALRIIAPDDAPQAAPMIIPAPAREEAEMAGTAAPIIEKQPRRARGEAPRVTRLYALPDSRPRGVPEWFSRTTPMPLARPLPVAGAKSGAPDVPVLTPRQTARGLIKAMLSVPTPSGPVDVAATVERLARGDPILRLPLRPARGLSRGATLVLDAGAWLDPYRRDAVALLKAVRNLIGPDRLTVIRTDAEPPPIADGTLGRSGEDKAGSLTLRPGTPILVISDFGLSPGEDLPARTGPAGWARFGDAVRAGGCEPIGLLPFPDASWPAGLARAFALLHWTPGTTARAARRAREHGGGKPGPAAASAAPPDAGLSILQMACAAAGRVDPELLRALRLELLPDSSPGLEARLWWGEEVGSRGAAAITLSLDRLSGHRAELRREQEIAGRAIATVRRLRGSAAPMLKLEEEIVGLELQRPAGWQATVVDRLRALLRSLLQNPDDPPRHVIDAARYFLASLPELELPPEALPLARDLVFAADQLLGAVSQAEGEPPASASPWVADMMNPTSGPATSPVSVKWDSGGLRLEPGDEGEHVLRLGGMPPTLSVEWADEGEPTGWMAMNRTHIVPAPPADHAELVARDGGRWIIEDADAADSLVPLRLFALVHPEDRDAGVEDYLTRIEIQARRNCGLPATAPVLLRNFLIEGWNQLPSWRDRPRLTGSISTWRGAVSRAVEGATAFLILVTEAMLREDWTSEVLRLIADRAKRSPPGLGFLVLAVDRDQRSELNPHKFLDHHGLDQAIWMSASDDSPAAIGEALAAAWRSGPRALEVAKLAPAPEPIDLVIDALQSLTLTFHVHGFGKDFAFGRGGEPDPNIWGFATLPRARDDGSSPEDSVARRLAAADFEFVRGMAEYLYAGPVRNYLHGRDPFRPEHSIQALRDRLERGPGFYSSSGESDFRIGQILRCFDRFASMRGRQRFEAITGFPLGPETRWDGPASGGDAWTLAELIHPYSSEFYTWRERHDFSFQDCRTFPEFMQAYSGLLQHYLRSLARAQPDLEAVLNFSGWKEHWEDIRAMFPASFEYLHMQERAKQTASPERMPIIEYVDLVTNLSDVLAFILRSRASSRLSDDGAGDPVPPPPEM